MKEILVLVVICILLAMTNPTAGDHKAVLFEELRTQATQGGGVLGILGNLGVNIAESLNLIPFTYSNYYLFSTMSLEGRIVSIGVLSMVFVLPPQ